jgi:hypothetical protein
MPKFMYIGDAAYTMAGVSGARFIKNKINEVSDERLAGFLRTIPEQFKEVSQDDVPEYPKPVSLMPRQGDPHPDPRVSALLRGEKTERQDGEPVTVGNLNREDQREANTAAIAGKEAKVDELAEEGGPATPDPIPTPESARKRK